MFINPGNLSMFTISNIKQVHNRNAQNIPQIRTFLLEKVIIWEWRGSSYQYQGVYKETGPSYLPSSLGSFSHQLEVKRNRDQVQLLLVHQNKHKRLKRLI